MIYKNEVRIGNYVEEAKEVVVVAVGTFTDWDKFNFGYFLKPIPLTEEWLIKLGFKYMFENKWLSIGMFGIRSDFEYFVYGFPKGEEKDYFVLECKYVHQLQNLYFALTLKELKEK